MENNENKQLKASTAAKRQEKKDRREAKAARKAANKVEEKKSRPNNIILGVLIFGVLIGMFVFVKGYTYFSKDASIEKYLEKNKETYENMQLDMYTTAALSAKGNSLKIVLDSTVEGDDAETIKDYYSGDDGKEQLEYIGSYFLTSIKPNVRGFSADVEVTYNLNDEELNKVSLTYKEAKKVMEPDEEEAEAEDQADDESDAEEAENAGDADSGEDTQETETESSESDGE